MNTGNIGIKEPADIGISNIDVYGNVKDDYVITGELDYICVNDAYKHKKGTTYYDLDNKGIILNDNCKPYAFVGEKTPEFKGRLAIIENIETGKLFYPKRSYYNEEKHGYIGTNSYNEYVVEFEDYKKSSAKGVKIYASRNGEYFENEKSIGKFEKCRECAGLPKMLVNKKPIDTNAFTINKKTFSLPDKFSVIASDKNEITNKMTILIENDRRKKREDKEDQTSHSDSVPSNEEAAKTFKKVATLWNNYENQLYFDYLKPLPDPQGSILFNLEVTNLDNLKLLMPELIQNGKLYKVSELFIQNFFENKIKGFANAPLGLYSFYKNPDTLDIFQKAGSELVHNFYNKKGESYYKTKVIADAIYKTDFGKTTIENVIKLVDQIFQYQFSKNPAEIKNNKFLKKILDGDWFKEGIDVETFPAFGISSLDPRRPDEERIALFCIGGTQGLKVAIKNFKPISTGSKLGYEATIIVQYLDTFGVSESDFTKDLGVGEMTNLTEYNYRGGVMAQWILQHQYNYKPFTDYLTYTVKMGKMWKK
ncbi:hypothetical protein SAMN05444267_102079 [Chryseobacterium polytrichastri]|uniref:Uncharacterized protein n=2 Tax=Chryseobacterium polytrichastri TaxID=1302687 RepID=A0A1M7BT36_9FLAO|nr:hypothetical protein SAMN05444267_102079 [Chryseobacterium polytrichastri]